MSTQTQTQKTNDLRFSTLAHDSEGNPIYIKIRLNDECKNGHQDFAITADIYQKGKPKTDRYFISGGCCHDEIIAARPDLSMFVNLHLCDYQGIPTYAVENGFYHLRQGFNTTKPEQPAFKAKFCGYYRISAEQFDSLNESANQLQYALKLRDLGILEQWKIEANKAIATLEEWTGKEFVVDSVKTQYHAPTPEELEEEKQKQESGYYTPEAKAQRIEQQKINEMVKLFAERDKKLNAINEEYEVKAQVLEFGGKIALDNCIYYNHSRTLAFNWRNYDRISQDMINSIVSKLSLPEGIKIENKP